MLLGSGLGPYKETSKTCLAFANNIVSTLTMILTCSLQTHCAVDVFLLATTMTTHICCQAWFYYYGDFIMAGRFTTWRITNAVGLCPSWIAPSSANSIYFCLRTYFLLSYLNADNTRGALMIFRCVFFLIASKWMKQVFDKPNSYTDSVIPSPEQNGESLEM